MNKQTQVTQILGTKYPLIQAPMSWITDANLVAAVSNAGGLGVLGPNAGQTELTTDLTETIERLRQEIRQTKKLTDKPFGLNLIIMTENGEKPDEFLTALLAMAFEEKVRHFAIVGNAHQEIFNQIKAQGGVIIYRPLTPTVANMQEAERFGADILVATGYDEGGHIPTRPLGTFTVVPTMVDAVNVPVLAAGGINDRRGVKAAFALGAAGVYIGTRFIATQESPAAENVKQLMVNSGYDDVLAVSNIQRSIRTPMAEKLAAQYQDPSNTQDMNAVIAQQGGLRPAMRLGELDNGIVSVNTGVDIIKTVPSVADLIQDLMETHENKF